jgi:hypothetical protein
MNIEKAKQQYIPECDFIWTAKQYVDGKIVQTLYFAIESERDKYVSSHPGWKKRGKICPDNLEKHLREANSSFIDSQK